MCVDLFCGLGGWAEGFLAEGYDVIGFDITRHVYGEEKYPAQLVLQDVLTIDGAQLRNADIIVASPPCQQYSWLAMPWSRSKTDGSQSAKALRHKWETEGPDNRLFDACFRIQREASEAAGRPIPMVVENVRGAQEWVGRPAKARYGSFYLWGDVEQVGNRIQAGADIGVFGRGLNVDIGVKIGGAKGGWFGDYKTREGRGLSEISCNSSKSAARKRASAMIAKIPLELARYVAQAYYPETGPASPVALRRS